MRRRTFLQGMALISIATLPSYAFNFSDFFGKDDNDKNKDGKSKDPLQILIPLYSYPNWQDDDYIWQKVIDVKEKYPESTIITIVNPNNGNFESANNDFKKGIKDLSDAGITVIGYVYTGFGDRDYDEIVHCIENWAKFYKESGVQGIFFDETSTEKSLVDFYRKLSNEAKERDLPFIVLNCGITTDQEYIDSGIASIVVTYEDTQENLQNNPPQEYNKPSQNTALAMLISEMQGDSVKDLEDFAREHDFGAIYLTEDGADGNAWDSVSAYLEKEVSYALNKDSSGDKDKKKDKGGFFFF